MFFSRLPAGKSTDNDVKDQMDGGGGRWLQSRLFSRATFINNGIPARVRGTKSLGALSCSPTRIANSRLDAANDLTGLGAVTA